MTPILDQTGGICWDLDMFICKGKHVTDLIFIIIIAIQDYIERNLM